MLEMQQLRQQMQQQQMQMQLQQQQMQQLTARHEQEKAEMKLQLQKMQQQHQQAGLPHDAHAVSLAQMPVVVAGMQGARYHHMMPGTWPGPGGTRPSRTPISGPGAFASDPSISLPPQPAVTAHSEAAHVEANRVRGSSMPQPQQQASAGSSPLVIFVLLTKCVLHE